MYRFHLRLLVLLAGCFCLPLCLAYVMGPDNRMPVVEAHHDDPGIRQTGMIRIHGEEFVSGLLTGANCDVVISAGHAAIYWQDLARKGWRRGELRGGGKFRFSLAPAREDSWADLRLWKSGYQDENKIGRDEHDWSIFRSETALSQNCETILIAGASCGDGLVMPGFHFDRPLTRLLDNSCEIKQRSENGIVVHDCDTKDGSSGAPLFCRANDRLHLLGLNISGLTHRDYYDAGVFGQSGQAYHDRQHKNFAIRVSGEFYRTLMEELDRSRMRAEQNDKYIP